MKKLFKITAVIGCIIIVMLCFSVSVCAKHNGSTDDVYKKQLESIDSQGMLSAMPEQARESLSNIGISSADIDNLTSLDTKSIFEEIISLSEKSSKAPINSFAICIGIMLLCTVTEGFRFGLAEKRLLTVQNAVGAVCVCTAVIMPLGSLIYKTSEIINGAAGFMLLYVPVLAGLLLTSGRETTAAAYYGSMMTFGNFVSAVSSKIVIPLMNVFLALSLTSAVSPKLSFGSLCGSLYKTAKQVLVFVMSVFVTVTSIQTIVTSSMDNVSKRTIRFALGSFVPVVGNVVGEAITTFNGSLDMLRAGAGVFVIIASGLIVLPVLLECTIWRMALYVLDSSAEILGLSQMRGVFKALSGAAGLLTAVIICILMVFIITTVVILVAGRGE
ncbi:MAG: hypothetical protein II059_03055 [Clostridia bacterium]|nr:hypothetical protein [Clostridia bacterium]